MRTNPTVLRNSYIFRVQRRRLLTTLQIVYKLYLKIYPATPIPRPYYSLVNPIKLITIARSPARKPPGSALKSLTKTNLPANDSNNNEESLYLSDEAYNNKSINEFDYKNPLSPSEFRAREKPNTILILIQPKDK